MAPASTNKAASDFLAWYDAQRTTTETAASALEQHIARLLEENNYPALMITARAKTMESIRGKLLRKPYMRPRSQLTDRIGVRIIVYHASEVDRAAVLLRSKLDVREKYSSDKRKALGLREFGYRSYHIVASLPPKVATAPALWSLRGQVFEVQIRSLLEHIWAEIEHDVVYKSGADWPEAVRRRFASLAGVLELLEHEFSELTSAATELTEEAVASLRAHMNLNRNLDVPTMCALLELEHPQGMSFRNARTSGSPFPPGIEQRLQLALRRSRIETARAFLRLLRKTRMRICVRRYSEAEGIPRNEVSHLALLAIAVGVRARPLLRTFFPEFSADASVQYALKTRPARSGARGPTRR